MIELGEVGYLAYCHVSGGKSLVSGDTLPIWAELPEKIREAWRAAADAVRMAAEEETV